MRKTTTLLALMTVLALALPAAADEDTPPDLSGIWILDKEASDDPATILAQSRGQGRGQGGGGGGMKGGGGGGGGGGRRGGGGGRSTAMSDDENPAVERQGADMAVRLQKRIERMEIASGGGEFTVTDGLDITRMMHTDGRQETVWTERGEARASARWQGQAMEITWAGGRGQERTTRFESAADGSQLVVLEQVPQPGGGKPVTLRLVYRRQP
jgi:hypothetical protein